MHWMFASKFTDSMGLGLFESVYEELVCYELSKTGILFQRQHPVPLIYEEIKLECGFRADVVLEGRIILELKSVEEIAKVHFK